MTVKKTCFQCSRSPQPHSSSRFSRKASAKHGAADTAAAAAAAAVAVSSKKRLAPKKRRNAAIYIVYLMHMHGALST